MSGTNPRRSTPCAGVRSLIQLQDLEHNVARGSLLTSDRRRPAAFKAPSHHHMRCADLWFKDALIGDVLKDAFGEHWEP